MQLGQSALSPARTRITLFLLAVIYVFSYIDRNLIAIVIEPIKQEFGVSDTVMGAVSGLAFAVLYSAFSFPLSRLADSGVNRRNIVAVCCGLWSFATMASGMVAQFWQFVIFRMTVAIGEAGGTSPSISMVSDLYPPHKRSFAISLYMLGPHIGLLAAMALGGWVAQEYGWRAVFIFFGAPGIVLALLLYIFGRDPGMGVFDTEAEKKVRLQPQGKFLSDLKDIIKIKGFLLICMGTAIAGMVGYGYGIWAPTFMVRNFDMTLAHAGLSFGLASGIFAAAGSMFSGFYCDKLCRTDTRWQLRLPMIGVLISIPLGCGFLFWPADAMWHLGSVNIPHAIVFAAGFSFFNSWWPTLSFAAVSNLVNSKQRATSVAMLALFLTLFGAGVGPLLTGTFSDIFSRGDEGEGLQFAILLMLLMLVGSAFLYYKAIKPYHKHMTEMGILANKTAESTPESSNTN
ncbi:spinster family MFS transporter [Aliiglaciecola lipolytica]|uniref:Major facilitator superfamily MFS_1 n=1 Tax=Aliiglaciecola lipolytica E3 TaxID=1127673 RepID=K6X000_9ALTE|nr:MFS transporter [Aliiglaciecola lipolytica]GAC13999.1 major facilitator superfamily MFS_1 [Aliiglaciecola lipolytica E3]